MIRILCGPLLVLVLLFGAAALSASRAAARSILNLPATPYRYASVELPAHIRHSGPSHDNTPPENPLSDDGATLGRVLFYDTRLSANNTTSCASCHVQAHAFADPKPASKGFHGALTDRRAMPLVNLRYDGRSHAGEDWRGRRTGARGPPFGGARSRAAALAASAFGETLPPRERTARVFR